MEKQHKTTIFFHLVVITINVSLAIASFALCIICEYKKSKKNELQVDGGLCYLPRSQAFAYGIATLVCSSIAQVIGSGFFVFCRRSRDFKSSKTSIASILLILSWTSFFIFTILIGTATGMNERQKYGKGWMDNTCYLVKNGVYVASGILVLVSMSSTLLSCYLTLNKNRAVHAQGK